MAGYIEQRETSSSIKVAACLWWKRRWVWEWDGVTGWSDRPTGPHRSGPCQRALHQLIGSLVGPPGASDPAWELIMEPNSCCDAPINKNHFTLIFPPLLASALFCLPTDCALCLPRPPTPPVSQPCGLVLSFYHWKQNPTTWLTTVASRKARRIKRFDKLHGAVTAALTANAAGEYK